MKKLLTFIILITLLTACASTHKGCDGKKKFRTNMN